jgi:hypothetical protein
MVMAIKHMDIGEFVDAGYLQEVNRRFFHPLGLALEVTECDSCGGVGYNRPSDIPESEYNKWKCTDCDGKGQWISGVWDYRDDPEGVLFDGELRENMHLKKAAIDDVWTKRAQERMNALGFVIQEPHHEVPPIPDPKTNLDHIEDATGDRRLK